MGTSTISANSSDISNEINLEIPFENEFAFMKSPNKKIDKEEIISYWNEQLDLEERVDFQDFEIDFTDPGEYDKQYFMIKARSLDGRISIGSHLNIENNTFLLTGEECICTTSDCSSNGCEVNSGPGCSCSYCSGECTKTHKKIIEEA